jgi:hypothetical protein
LSLDVMVNNLLCLIVTNGYLSWIILVTEL